MQPVRSLIAVAAGILAVALSAGAQVHAANVTFVSQTGTGDCLTPATACGDISLAIQLTQESGVVHVAPGEYFAFNVDRAISIIVDGGQASITNSTVSGPAEIRVVASATDEVRIRGFLLDGSNVSADGVVFVSGGALRLEDCTFVTSDFYGVAFKPSGASELYVSNSAISGGGGAAGGGILIKPTGSGSAKVVLDHVNVENNTGGVLVDGSATSGANSVTVRNSVMSGNTSFGLRVVESGAGSSNVSLESSTTNSNGTNGVAVSGASGIVRMRNSTSNNNTAAGLVVASGGQIVSHGGNVVAGNGTNGLFTSTVAQQ